MCLEDTIQDTTIEDTIHTEKKSSEFLKKIKSKQYFYSKPNNLRARKIRPPLSLNLLGDPLLDS